MPHRGTSIRTTGCRIRRNWTRGNFLFESRPLIIRFNVTDVDRQRHGDAVEMFPSLPEEPFFSPVTKLPRRIRSSNVSATAADKIIAAIHLFRATCGTDAKRFLTTLSTSTN